MDGKKSYLFVILIQSIYAGMFILTKAALDVGMNAFIFVFYRQAAATLFLAPIAMYIGWNKAPPLSFGILCKIFMLSLFGISVSLNLYNVALIYTSATLAAATTNCLPVITFFIAVLLRMENVKLRTMSGIAKVVGIVLCMGGVMTIALYRGPYLKLLLHHHLFTLHNHAQPQLHLPSHKTWLKGVFIMLLANTFWASWLVLQARVLKNYPSKLLFTALQCLFSSIQSFVIAIALERNPYQWKLGWNVRLLAVAYSGIMVTGVTFYLQTCVIEKKGPVFLAMSMPLALIITIFCSAFLLGEIISLGSILGGIFLVGGLYCVLWGKSKENKISDVGACLAGEDEKGCSESKDATPAIGTPPPLLV